MDPSIGVYDLRLSRKLRSLTSKELPGEFSRVAVCSEESKTLVTLSLGLDAPLALWDYEKGKVLALIKTEADITRITVSPYDATQVCTSGPIYMRFWKAGGADVGLKVIPNQQPK